jgi:hypothetical protein
VPTASEVKEQGVDVGDTQVLLLKKIEELTLYMININNELEKMKVENASIKNCPDPPIEKLPFDSLKAV